ncbi:MAG: hypothetical protein HGGPFJEG_01905 [Ignavibacteria bacterium]|nr:hypothetical protein [Ignavibacteria bacterium]
MPRDYRHYQEKKDNKNFKKENASNTPKKPFAFMIDSFYDEAGNLKAELISNVGEKNVEQLSSLISTEGTKTSQIRKFYDSFIKSYNNFLNIDSKKENVFKVQLLILKAQVEYSYARRNVKQAFKDFIDNRFDLVIKSDKFRNDFKALKSHFEVLIAYLPKN